MFQRNHQTSDTKPVNGNFEQHVRQLLSEVLTDPEFFSTIISISPPSCDGGRAPTAQWDTWGVQMDILSHYRLLFSQETKILHTSYFHPRFCMATNYPKPYQHHQYNNNKQTNNLMSSWFIRVQCRLPVCLCDSPLTTGWMLLRLPWWAIVKALYLAGRREHMLWIR